jgi:hypothetical protein
MATIAELENIVSQVRRDIVRMVNACSSGHPGGSLGCADVMCALYFDALECNPENFTIEGNGEDMFFLSNGHISPVWYSVLARKGFFPVSDLATFRQMGSALQGHPTPKYNLPGVGLAQALIGNPKVLILDEPTVGLDPKQIIEIRTLIRKLGKNHTVILSSHILSEVQAVCDKIIVINEGKVVANDTEEHLSQKLSGEHKLTAKIQGDKDKIVRAMQGIKGVEKVICDASHKDGVNDIRIEAKEGVDIRRDVFETVVKNGWYMLELKTSELSLEDIFLKLTMGEALPALENTSDKEGND